ncbi:MAG: trigger factor [Gammaproteobacteria bacterium HGW-Gammaproteobacteria-14]|nr:MAG: trigger factor [Gammaproteobacteria bacterium HGW-Gammaproteobacteria-14]
MQVSVESTSGLERRLTVAVPAERLDGAVEQRLLEAQKNLRIDGFRPGKVPMREVKRRFAGSVRGEVLSDVMRDCFVKAIEEQKLEPAGMPRFEATKNEPGKDLEFVAIFDVFPEITLASFDGISVEKPVAEVTEADLDTMIDNLRKQRASWETAERAVEQGDRVNIDYEGFKGEEAFAGGSAKGQNLVIGSGTMIPGFEDGLVGLKAGDSKTLQLTFPEDYQAEELKGQAVEFKLTVNKVEAQKLPEIDAEFMKAFGVSDGDLAHFRTEVKKNMERELSNAVRAQIKAQVMDGLVNSHEFDVPTGLVSNEIQRMRQQMMQQFGGGQQFDASILPDDLFREQAERSVRLGLVVRQILEQNQLKADADKVRARIEEIAEQYEEPAEVVKYFYGNRQQLEQVEGAVLEEQVVELVLASAQQSDKASSYEEVVASQRGGRG